MTMQPATNGASRGAKLKAMAAKAGTAPAVPATRKPFITPRDSYDLKVAARDDLAARLAKEDSELAAWGQRLALDNDPDFCRLCGHAAKPSAPVVDPKGGFRVRRVCKTMVNGQRCSSRWWAPAPSEEAS